MEERPDLNGIFSRIGNEFGYSSVFASFVESADLKIKWARTGSMIEFWITDYLSDAPENVLESLARTVFGRMRDDMDSPYGNELIEYLTTEEFLKRYQPIYLSRKTNASATPVGRFKDLRKCVDRLIERDMVKPLPNTYIGWLPAGLGDGASISSPVMRSIFVNSKLDSPDTPDDVLDFCVYMQMVKLEIGFDPKDFNNMNRRFVQRVESYPDFQELMSCMSVMGVSAWKGMSPEC